MKVCIHKITRRLLETQFGIDGEVLLRNNKQYYPEAELEIIDMSREEIIGKIQKQNEEEMSKEQKDEIKIKEEMSRILREMAIKSLKDKGEL